MEGSKPVNPEELLQQIGLHEVPGVTEHRYAVRRALLNSKDFDCNKRTNEWVRFFGVTSSIIAGSAVVAVLVFSVSVSVPKTNLKSVSEAQKQEFQPKTNIHLTEELLPEVRFTKVEEVVPINEVKSLLKDYFVLY